MSELKTRFVDYTYVEYFNTGKHDLAQIYLKSEADKVIAELKESVKGLILDNYLKDKELRHQKYKRCLAMALWCSAELGMLVSTWESKIKYYKRWQKRWLELAEKFKEA